MERNFKIGDEVLMSKFIDGKIDFTCFMKDSVGTKGYITKKTKNGYRVNDKFTWPASALTLVTKEEEFKNGEEVEISNDGEIWGNSTRSYLCKTSKGLHATEHKDGTICAFAYCRRPQPKMQKWNVWVRDGDLPGLLKEGYHFPNGTIVHTFEIPA